MSKVEAMMASLVIELERAKEFNVGILSNAFQDVDVPGKDATRKVFITAIESIYGSCIRLLKDRLSEL